MKSLTSWFVLIVSIAVLVSSCSSEDSKTASTDNTTSSSGGSSSTTELEGTWVSSCYQTSWDNDLYDIQSITFTGSAFIFKWETHSDSSCANDFATWTDTYSSFSIGDETTLDNGSTVRKISMKVDSLEALMQTEAAATAFNNFEYCGYTDWAINTTKDYTGRTCDDDEMWSANTSVYGVYLLDGNCVTISKFSSSGYRFGDEHLRVIMTKQSATSCADITPPTVSSISPADSQTGVQISDTISVTFSEAMNIGSVTVNTDNTTCYGSLALSSDNFSTCVKMSSSKTNSNANKTLTFRASPDSVFRDTTYKIRVTTAVKDRSGNSLSSQYETSNGYTTTSGLFVAVGVNGTILTSDNGTEWTARTSGTTENLNRVAYGDGRYIVVGENATYKYSDNASSWSESKTSGNVHFNDIEYFGNSNWGGAADYAHTTRQNVVGDQFSSGPITEDQSSYFFKNYNGLTIGDDIILVGEEGFIAWSPDNDSRYQGFWTKVSGTTSNLMGTVHGNSIYAIVGDNGTILTSDNGSTWTSRADGRTDNLSEVTFGNNTFIAVGDNGTIRTSSDNGTTWDNRTSGTTKFYGVTFGKNTFIAVGDNGTIRTSSDNGSTWTSRTSGTTVNLRGVGF
jgi:hypothetical protein